VSAYVSPCCAFIEISHRIQSSTTHLQRLLADPSVEVMCRFRHVCLYNAHLEALHRPGLPLAMLSFMLLQNTKAHQGSEHSNHLDLQKSIQ
jgi:hypothetical protein